MDLNKRMGDCFKIGGLLLGLSAVMAAAPGAKQVRKPTIVVKADTRSGHLIRTVIVPPKPAPVVAVPAAAPGAALTSPIQPAPSSSPLNDLIDATAKRYEVDPLLVHSVIAVESNYNPYALSPKGAQGLMQLIPSTARRFGVANTFDVQQNVEGGVRYLKYLNTLFPNDPVLAIAAYNAGEAAVWKYGNTIPPYRETLQYVERVGQKYGRARNANAAKAVVAHPASSPAPAVTPQAADPAPERYSAVETYVDASGRLSLRSRTETANP